MVDVVQLVRASDCGSECRGFESHLPPIKALRLPISSIRGWLFYFHIFPIYLHLFPYSFSSSIHSEEIKNKPYKMTEGILYGLYILLFDYSLCHLWELRIILKTRLAFLQESLTAFLSLIHGIIEHRCITSQLLDTSLPIQLCIQASLDHTES